MIASSRGVIVALLPVFFLPSRFFIAFPLSLRLRIEPSLVEPGPLLALPNAPSQHVQAADQRRNDGQSTGVLEENLVGISAHPKRTRHAVELLSDDQHQSDEHENHSGAGGTLQHLTRGQGSRRGRTCLLPFLRYLVRPPGSFPEPREVRGEPQELHSGRQAPRSHSDPRQEAHGLPESVQELKGRTSGDLPELTDYPSLNDRLAAVTDADVLGESLQAS